MLPEDDASLDPLLAVLRRFEGVQREYAKLGAQDTEPDGEWHCVLRHAVEGEPFPTDLNWQLFSEMEGAAEADGALTAAAKHVHATILLWRDNAPAGQWRKMESVIFDYAWRVYH